MRRRGLLAAVLVAALGLGALPGAPARAATIGMTDLAVRAARTKPNEFSVTVDASAGPNAVNGGVVQIFVTGQLVTIKPASCRGGPPGLDCPIGSMDHSVVTLRFTINAGSVTFSIRAVVSEPNQDLQSGNNVAILGPISFVAAKPTTAKPAAPKATTGGAGNAAATPAPNASLGMPASPSADAPVVDDSAGTTTAPPPLAVAPTAVRAVADGSGSGFRGWCSASWRYCWPALPWQGG